MKKITRRALKQLIKEEMNLNNSDNHEVVEGIAAYNRSSDYLSRQIDDKTKRHDLAAVVSRLEQQDWPDAVPLWEPMEIVYDNQVWWIEPKSSDMMSKSGRYYPTLKDIFQRYKFVVTEIWPDEYRMFVE